MSEYSKIEVNLDDDVKISLISLFVTNNLDKASQEAFTDTIKSGGFLEDALYAAVLNEMIIEAMMDQFEKQEGIPIDIIGEDASGC